MAARTAPPKSKAKAKAKTKAKVQKHSRRAAGAKSTARGNTNVEQERFVRSFDGTELYATTIGSGPPIVQCDGLGCDGFVWAYLTPAFKEQHQIIHWHYRGHGLSQPPQNPSAVSVDDLCRDLLAVLDAFGIDRPVLLGHSMGVQLILEFGLQHPDRVQGLVPMCGSYGRPLDTLRDSDLAASIFPYVFRLTRRFPMPIQKIWSRLIDTELAYQIGSHFELNPSLVLRGDFKPYFTHLGSMDVRVFMRMLEQLSQHSVEDRLHLIRAPTLVVAGEGDTFTPAWLSLRMQQLIPDAELLMVPTGTHGAPIEIPELVHLRLEQFLLDRVWPKERAPSKIRVTGNGAAKSTAATRKATGAQKSGTNRKAKRTTKRKTNRKTSRKSGASRTGRAGER